MQGKLREHTDFKQDSLIYGPIGENRLKEILLEQLGVGSLDEVIELIQENNNEEE